MKEYERKSLLAKVEKDSASLGSEIPETIEVQGENINLRNLIFSDLKDDLDGDFIYELENKLKDEKKDLYNTLKEGKISYDEGLDIVERISGIERALTILNKSSEDIDINKKIKRKEKKDYERWVNFLKKVRKDK